MGSLCGFGESAGFAVTKSTRLPEYFRFDGNVHALVTSQDGKHFNYERLHGIAARVPFSPPDWDDICDSHNSSRF